MSSTSTNINEIEINGVKYVKEGSGSPPPTGKRVVLVVDRGWIFAGDCERVNDRIKLTRAVWLLSWTSIGFDGVLKNPKDSNVKLRKMEHDVDVPKDAEVFCIPVCDNWGL
jgi:hypothetical protein